MSDALPGVHCSVLLERHRERLQSPSVEVCAIVLILRQDIVDTANAFADELGPAVTVHVLGSESDLGPDARRLRPRVRYVFADSLRTRLDYLMRIDRPQAIIEAGDRRRAHKDSCLRHLFYFVTPGGFYAVEELDACGDPRYDDGAGETVLALLTKVAAVASMAAPAAAKARAYVRHMAANAGRIEFDTGGAVVERQGERQFVKLRDWESDAVLSSRYGQDWGQVVERRAAVDFVSRTDVINHGDGPIPSGRRTFSVPERYLRRYSNAICSGRQVVRFGEYLLPDTWRHPHQQTLGNRHLVTTSPYFGTYQEETRPTETRPLAGAFYYLDTELPGHFGHITTEVLSRVWAWRTAVAENPSVRLLMGANRLPATIPGYQRMILQALGMRVDDAVILGPRQAVEVETLYGPTPQLENPHHVDPDIAEVWAQLGAGLPDGKPATADRIFISRRPSVKRHCRQTPDVERFFATNGFEIVFPEDHPYQDQKAMFARARVIAGFGGSGMFNAMFAPQARLIVISGDSYNAQNEHLIAAANGNELHYFWGKSEVPMPENRFSLPAFTSAFDFDLRRHKRALRRVIR